MKLKSDFKKFLTNDALDLMKARLLGHICLVGVIVSRQLHFHILIRRFKFMRGTQIY
jgi:hypothetical protein